jgi:hypothetical protein
MSREIQAGARVHLPLFSSTLNAAIAPSLTGPFSIGALNFKCFGPQNGVSTQRVPFESSQLFKRSQRFVKAICLRQRRVADIRII